MTVQKRNAEMVNILSADFVKHGYYESNAMRPVYNVQGPSFGAVADGATNDRQAFADADAVALAEGGLAYAPPGNYEITSSITLSGNWFTAPGVTFTNVTPTFNARYELGLGTGGAVDHGSLSGLGDDDHTQYAKHASTETISGAWTFSTRPLLELTTTQLRMGYDGSNYWDYQVDSSGNLDLTPTGGGNLRIRDSDLAIDPGFKLQSWTDDELTVHNIMEYTGQSLYFGDEAGNHLSFVFWMPGSLLTSLLDIDSTDANLNVPLVVTDTTTPQLQVRYDGSNYADFAVDSAGNVDFAPTGSTLSLHANVVFDNADYLYWRNNADTTNVQILGFNTGDDIVIGDTLGNVDSINFYRPNQAFIISFSIFESLIDILDDVRITATDQPQLKVQYDANNYVDFTVSSSGNLTVAPTGDFYFDPTGDDILPVTGYDLNIGAVHKKYLRLYAAELWVETLVAQETIATIGGRILVGPTTTLTRDVADTDTTIYVKHNQMANGDIAYMEAYNPSTEDGGPLSRVEFFQITSAPTTISSTPPDTEYSYTVTRNLDGSGANFWYAGESMFNTGTYSGGSGDGFIDLYSLQGVDAGSTVGPTIVGNVRQSTTYNDWAEHWAIGNLNGLYGYGVDTYGVGLGEYGAGNHLTIDSTDGIQFYNNVGTTVIGQFNSSTITLGDTTGNHLQLDASTIQLFDSSTVMRFYLDSSGVQVGRTGDARTVITDSALSLFDASNNERVNLGAGTLWIGDSASTERFEYDGTDLAIFGPSAEKFRVESDGDIFVGDDISVAGGTYFAIFSAAQTYNTESVAAGDMLIGDNSASKANIFWDKSEGQLLFRGGQTTQVYVDTDGSVVAGGGDVVMDSTGLEFIGDTSAFQGGSKALRWYNSTFGAEIGILESWASGTTSETKFASHTSTNDEFGMYLRAGTVFGGNNVEFFHATTSLTLFYVDATDADFTGNLDIDGDLSKNDTVGYIYVPLSSATTVYNNVTKTGSGNEQKTYTDLGVPQDAVAIHVRVTVRSSTQLRQFWCLPTVSNFSFSLAVKAVTTSQYHDAQGIVKMDSDAVYFQWDGTCDIYAYVMGYFI